MDEALSRENLISSLVPQEAEESQVKEMDQFQIVIVVRPTFARITVLVSSSSLQGSTCRLWLLVPGEKMTETGGGENG